MRLILILACLPIIGSPGAGISFYHIVVKTDDGSVEVIESFSIDEELPGLALELPEGFFDLRPAMGFPEGKVRVSGRCLVCDAPLKPGVFSFRYRLKAAKVLDLSRSFPLKVERLAVILGAGGISIRSDGFRREEGLDPRGRRVRVYSMDGVEAGRRVEIALMLGSGSPKRAIWLLASAAFVLLFALSYALILMRRADLARSGESGSNTDRRPS
ncbi:hypothetical protein DRP77_05215 [Candidatus Poribacteria bacterium]|nr:MAG: hypothetical protein DRP77_05215 [Candidatus Poribacteria bacterium]